MNSLVFNNGQKLVEMICRKDTSPFLSIQRKIEISWYYSIDLLYYYQLLLSIYIKEEISKEISKYFELNENKKQVIKICGMR